MNRRSRAKLAAAAGRLQEAYGRQRAVQRARFEQLVWEGAFKAPFAPIHGAQAELGLPEPLRLDEIRAEAA